MVRVFLVLCVALFSYPAYAGTVSGTVDLEPPKARRGSTKYAGALPGLGPPAPMVGVVYLTREGLSAAEPPAEPAVMRQRGLQFFPSILPISVGSSVVFPNEDDTYHNVFSYSPEKRFDLGRYAKGEKPPVVVFDQPGAVRVFCEVHEHMRAVVLVVDTPYFAATDVAGSFELVGVPAGDYTLHLWRLGHPELTREIRVSDEDQVIQF